MAARAGPRARWPLACLSVAALGLLAARADLWRVETWTRQSEGRSLRSSVPARTTMDGYVSSSACQSCHPAEYQTWHSSYHRTMTQVAGPDTVLGDFDDVELELTGRTYRLSRDGERFWVSSR